MNSAGSRPGPGTPAGPAEADLAVIGGGQLARMMQQAAIGLGVRIRLLAEGPEVSAAQVIPDHRVGDYTDLDDLRAVVADVPVVTFDHEHVPPEHLRALQAEGHACRPGPDALLFAQDKAAMGTGSGARRPVPAPRLRLLVADLETFGSRPSSRPPAAATTARACGSCDSSAEADGGLRVRSSPAGRGARRLPPRAVRAGRASPSGEVVASRWWSRARPTASARRSWRRPPISTRGWPPSAEIARAIATRARRHRGARRRAVRDTDGRLLVNELAMRPHNTGHWTIDGAPPASSRTTSARCSTSRSAPPRPDAMVGDGQHPRRFGRRPGGQPPTCSTPCRTSGPPVRQGGEGGPQGRPVTRRRRPHRQPRPCPPGRGSVREGHDG